jgi:hypothetical protein
MKQKVRMLTDEELWAEAEFQELQARQDNNFQS